MRVVTVRATALAAALALLAAATIRAEIARVAVVCASGICPRWWPVLPEVAGWRQDKDRSARDGLNAQVPEGDDFDTGEVVVYARAVLKTEGGPSLAAFIARDQSETRAEFPGIRVGERRTMQTADGQRLRSFAFSPRASGNWEIVSYGEEGDYYLLFALSATSAAALDRGRDAYAEFVRRYRAEPEPNPPGDH